MLKHLRIATLALVAVATGMLVSSPPAQPQGGYLGVQSCGTSSCHQHPTKPNAPAAFPSWAKDPHSFAFLGGQTGRGKRYGLQGAPAAKITKAMGLGDPTTEETCLRCHAGSVQPDGQAVKLKLARSGTAANLADGVQCESCHGPGVPWRDIHQTNHQEAVRLGMFDLLGPGNAGKQCEACHQNFDDKLTAAGHPDASSFNFGAYAESIKHWGGHFESNGDYVPYSP